MAKLTALLVRWDGRIGRQQFWLGVFIVFCVGLAASILLGLVGFAETTSVSGKVLIDGQEPQEFYQNNVHLSGWPEFIVTLLTSILLMIISVKRRRDRDFAGYDVIIYFVIFIVMQIIPEDFRDSQLANMISIVLAIWSTFLFVLLGCLKGTRGTNSFGFDPTDQSTASLPR